VGRSTKISALLMNQHLFVGISLNGWSDGVGWKLKLFTIWESYPVANFLNLVACDRRYLAFDDLDNLTVLTVIRIVIRIGLVRDINPNRLSSAELIHIR